MIQKAILRSTPPPPPRKKRKGEPESLKSKYASIASAIGILNPVEDGGRTQFRGKISDRLIESMYAECIERKITVGRLLDEILESHFATAKKTKRAK